MDVEKKIQSLTVRQLLIFSVILAVLIVLARNWNVVESKLKELGS